MLKNSFMMSMKVLIFSVLLFVATGSRAAVIDSENQLASKAFIQQSSAYVYINTYPGYRYGYYPYNYYGPYYYGYPYRYYPYHYYPYRHYRYYHRPYYRHHRYYYR